MEKNKTQRAKGDVESLSKQYEQVVASERSSIAQLLRAPNLFNWFIGLNSIVLGFVFILSSPLIQDFQTGRFASWFAPLQITLILGGIGLILSEMAERGGNLWRVIFRLILTGAFATLALIWWQGAEFDGVFLALWLSSVILFNVVADLSSLRSYLIFYQGLLIGLPLVIYFLPVSSNLHNVALQLTGDSPIYAAIWVIAIVAYVVLAWWGYFNDKQALSRLIGVASAPLVALALVYANLSDWVRAFLLLVTALFAFLLPFWDELRFRQEKTRQWVTRMFAVVAGLFLVTVVLIKILQNILISNASLVLSDKITYGKILAEGTVSSVLGAERSLAGNGLFITALAGSRSLDLDDLTAGFFKSNRALLRIVAVNTKGKVLSAYPLTTGLVGRDLSSADYFKKAVSDKTETVSEVTDSRMVDLTDRTVAMAIPVIQNKTVVGALIGFLDLGSLSDALGEVATPASDEYFVIMDHSGNWVIGPEGKSSEKKSDPLVITTTQKGILRQGYSQNGELAIAVNQKLSVVDWQMVLVQPMFTALAVNQTAYVVVLAVASLSVLIIGLTVLLERQSEELLEEHTKRNE